MSDNVAVKPSDASNAISVATDEVDGVHYPIYKLATGGDGLLAIRIPAPVRVAVAPVPERGARTNECAQHMSTFQPTNDHHHLMETIFEAYV